MLIQRQMMHMFPLRMSSKTVEHLVYWPVLA